MLGWYFEANYKTQQNLGSKDKLAKRKFRASITHVNTKLCEHRKVMAIFQIPSFLIWKVKTGIQQRNLSPQKLGFQLRLVKQRNVSNGGLRCRAEGKIKDVRGWATRPTLSCQTKSSVHLHTTHYCPYCPRVHLFEKKHNIMILINNAHGTSVGAYHTYIMLSVPKTPRIARTKRCET